MAIKSSKAYFGSVVPSKPIDVYSDQFRNRFGEDAYIGTRFLNELEQESANKQMSFQQFMSDTSHQREVADLQAAGLNPVLSANAGASTPAGASSSSDGTALSGTIQNRLLNKQIKAQNKLASLDRKQALKIAREQMSASMLMNKYSTDMSYQLGAYQSDNNLAGLKYQADASSSAQRFAALQAAMASMYGADQARAASEFASRTQYATGSQQRQHEKDMQTQKYFYDKNMKIWDWTHQNGIQGLFTNPINAMLGLSYYNTPNLYGRD